MTMRIAIVARPAALLLAGWTEPRHAMRRLSARNAIGAWPLMGRSDPRAGTRRGAAAPKGALVRRTTGHQTTSLFASRSIPGRVLLVPFSVPD